MKSAVSFALAAAIAGASAVEIPPDSFWAKREASYRGDPRGPFTAIRADYLKPGESLTLYATNESVGTSAVDGVPSLRVTFDAAEDFHVEPKANLEDLKLGRFLLSCDVQGEGVGRILAYDASLLETSFHGFPTFARDPAFLVTAKATAAAGDTILAGTSRGLEKSLIRAATLDFAIGKTSCRLAGYREPGETGKLFVPFRDTTSGEETYGAGRYLGVEWQSGAETAIVDFNHATNPWCAYTTYYNCILPPPENHLSVAIRAGEKIPAGGAHH